MLKMTARTQLKIPTENHSNLLVPDFSEISSALEHNEKRFAAANAVIADIRLSDFREMVRGRIAELLGLERDINQPILITAHQPGLWHPGIMYKCAVAGNFAGKYFLLSINVDSDVVSPISCKVPYSIDGRLTFTKTVLIDNENEQIIQMLTKPPRADLDSFLAKIEAKVATLPDDSVLKNFKKFIVIHSRQYNQSDTLSNWLTNCRKEYFPVKNLNELDLSELCNTDEFRLFALDILQNCKNFFDIYNSCLDNYRAEHKVRSEVNPFPNLEHRTDNNIELPFWLIADDGRRHPMCVNYIDKSILADHRDVIEGLSRDSSPDDLVRYEIRPKALLLTMFMRMFAGSIFIHGVGGGNYDEVTDAVIREYYRCEPPTYIIATRTEFPPIATDADIDETIKLARKELRNMEFNPDEYLDGDNQLGVEKRAILAKSRNDTTKAEYRRLKEIRLTLVKEIKDIIDGKEKEIERLEQQRSSVERVRRRDFPYFFYPPEALEG